MWRHLLKLVGNGQAPEQEHLLLRNARAALRRSQHRRAVIDAGTVIEMALWRLLQAEHQRSPTSLSALFLQQAERWTLGTLRETVAKLTHLPKELDRTLIKVRNQTVHRQAVDPTRTQAIRCVQAASDVLAIAAPLQAPFPSQVPASP